MARINKPHTQSPTTPLCTSKGCAVGWWLMPSDQRSEVPSSPYFKGNLVEELQVTTTLQATLQATLQPTATVQPPPHTEEGGKESVRKLQVREKYKAPAEWWGRKQGYHQGRELQVQEKYKAAVVALESYKPKATSRKLQAESYKPKATSRQVQEKNIPLYTFTQQSTFGDVG
jgi:hypothetical protein